MCSWILPACWIYQQPLCPSRMSCTAAKLPREKEWLRAPEAIIQISEGVFFRLWLCMYFRSYLEVLWRFCQHPGVVTYIRMYVHTYIPDTPSCRLLPTLTPCKPFREQKEKKTKNFCARVKYKMTQDLIFIILPSNLQLGRQLPAFMLMRPALLILHSSRPVQFRQLL